jgi:prephenate dehydrogenase
MTGSEKTGAENARPDLYKDATCVLTPGFKPNSAALRRAEDFWRSVGTQVVRMSPEDHDEWMALVSHLPHLLADSLVLTASSLSGSAAHVRRLAAGSFRDMTRVAGADPAQWSAIFSMNSDKLGDAAVRFQEVLSGLIRRRWPLSDLRKAKRFRDRFINRKPITKSA